MKVGGKWIATERGVIVTRGEEVAAVHVPNAKSAKFPLADRLSQEEFDALMVFRLSLPEVRCLQS